MSHLNIKKQIQTAEYKVERKSSKITENFHYRESLVTSAALIVSA